jgi:multiple sugar transport system substrate-binding protein
MWVSTLDRRIVVDRTHLTRRGLLRYGVGLTGLVVVTAACGQAATPAAPTSAPAAPAAPAAAPTTAPAAAAAATTAPAAAAAAATPTKAAAAAAPTAAPTAVPAATSAAGAGAVVQLQVSTRGGGDGTVMVQTIDSFQKQNPNVKLTHVSYGPEPDYWTKVEAVFATKQLADVVWASTGNLLNFANRSILGPLDDIIKGDSYDLTDYVPNALASLSLKGKLYAMPWGAHPGNGGLDYNATMLNAAGFTNVTDDANSILDWTYETLMQAAVKTTKQTGGKIDVYGYLPGVDYLSLGNVLGAYGADFFNADGTKLTMDTPEFLKGMNWVYDCFVTNKVSPAPNADGGSLFDSQKLAMYLVQWAGQFQPGINPPDLFKWNDSLQPKGPAGKRGTHLTINGQAMSAITQHQKESWSFIKFLMDPAQNIAIVLANGGRPAARHAVLDSPILVDKMKAAKVWATAIYTAEPWRQPANYRWPEFQTIMVNAFADCWVGKQTIEQALPNATKLLQAVMDKPAAT